MRTPTIPNLPGMGNAPTLQAQLSTVTGRVLLYCDRAVEGLTVEQFCDTRGGVTNSIGWDVWHVVRTIDKRGVDRGGGPHGASFCRPLVLCNNTKAGSSKASRPLCSDPI